MYFYRVYSPCSLTYSIIPKYILIVITEINTILVIANHKYIFIFEMFMHWPSFIDMR